LDQLHAELAQVESQVAAQNLSPDEVTRMNHERETLQRQLRDLASKNAEARQSSQDAEMAVTRMMDKFEQHLSDYTAFGYQIGTMIPTSDGPFLGPGGVDFTVDCDVSAEDVNEIQASGKRMREVVRPALSKYDEEIRSQTKVVGEEQAGLDEEIDKLGLAVDKQKGDESNKQLELSKKVSEADAAKTVSRPDQKREFEAVD
jgi:kinetochore protein NDC80